MTQLLVNLLENAIPHCLAGTAIAIGLEMANDRVVETIADGGPRIPEWERPKVYRRFYRLERSRSAQGNGLRPGLVRAIAELHGAKVELSDNEPGMIVTVKVPEWSR